VVEPVLPAGVVPRDRLPLLGIALLLRYLAPLLVALWARFVGHEDVRRRIWVALALALAGL